MFLFYGQFSDAVLGKGVLSSHCMMNAVFFMMVFVMNVMFFMTFVPAIWKMSLNTFLFMFTLYLVQQCYTFRPLAAAAGILCLLSQLRS